jgi:ubiquinone biosynthesis UbiH/UbiF/VisC/COQ6 family hydroxylase
MAAAHSTDVAIIGAGPAGLAMALRLSRIGLSCLVIEKQVQEKVANPAEDGREIALTHRSVAFLEALGVWPLIARHPLGQIRTAHVMNRAAASPLSFAAAGTGKERLSAMVPNHIIRRALYETVKDATGVTILFGREVTGVETDEEGGRITLDSGKGIAARLIVAADSRFSPARQMMGIQADRLDFKKIMIVSRLSHERPHDDVAYEWFQSDRTLAILPLAGKTCSAVLTVERDEAEQLLKLDDAAYATRIENWFEGRHGKMTLAGRRHPYPLVATYAQRFYAPSFAVAGDAAVGMHPVTAHGFNFGLQGVETLAGLIADARRRRQDWASAPVLAQYNRRHRLATRPLFLATNFIATLYTRRGPLSTLARHGLHALARNVPFARRLINRQLVDDGGI